LELNFNSLLLIQTTKGTITTKKLFTATHGRGMSARRNSHRAAQGFQKGKRTGKKITI
jgi:hypothetical protein